MNGGVTVRLRPITQDEFDPLIGRTFDAFVAELVNTGQVRPEDAAGESQRQRERLLPQGLDTEHMVMFIGEVDGERIGWLWLALPGAPNHVDSAWVYDIEVDEAHRGKGYGRGLLLAAEDELRARGVYKLGLNVFARNSTAMRLYHGLGFEVVTQQMAKDLTQPST